MVQDIKKIFANNLDFYLKLNNEKAIDLANSLQVNPSTTSGWLHAQKMPRAGMLQKIAEHYDIEITDLTADRNENYNKDKAHYTEVKNNPFLTWEGQPMSQEELEYMTQQIEMFRLYKKNKRQNKK